MLATQNVQSLSFSENLLRYFSLTKPKIIVLLSVTGLVGYFIPNPVTNFGKVIAFVYMGYASAGGAMAVNNYIDRDIDAVMQRTRYRASVNEINPPWMVAVFGGLLALSGILIAFFVFNPLTAYFLIFADVFYLTGYSLYLKRNSLSSTIIGGLISPTPVFVGFTAATGMLSLEGLLLGLIVFVWTPSHTFAMSAKNIEDYTAANIPMMPVVVGMKKTAWFTLLGGVITMVYGYYVVLTYFIPLNQITLQVILALVSLYFLYTLLLFVRDPTPETATICFRRGHTLWLSAVFILALF
ncbi:MAG: protoheme IX farnesyltransferase [Candidatus Heimdallarchaeota archaeon]|nr:protoheme IX farnesyltransferase [Candidatus Heimdallarchaeota archaeon]